MIILPKFIRQIDHRVVLERVVPFDFIPPLTMSKHFSVRVHWRGDLGYLKRDLFAVIELITGML